MCKFEDEYSLAQLGSGALLNTETKMSSPPYLDLPDECWETILKHINDPLDHESLSLVSKQLLSLTNSLRSSLSLTHQTLPFLRRLLRRFPNLNTIRVSPLFRRDLDALLRQIASSANLPRLRSLDLSFRTAFPSIGLRHFARNFPALKSLNCSHMSLTNADLVLIAECFKDLEELDISSPQDSDIRYNNSNDFNSPVSDLSLKALLLKLPKLRKVNISESDYLEDLSVSSLCKNCEFLEELIVVGVNPIAQYAIANAIRERPSLRSLSVSHLGVWIKKGDFRRDKETLIDALVSLKMLSCVDLSYSCLSDELLFAVAEEGLPLRKLMLQDCSKYSYDGLSCLLRKCQLLEHLDLRNNEFLNDRCVIELSSFLGNLISVNLSGNVMVTDSSFFVILQNCPLIITIKMEETGIGKQKVEEDLVVSSKLKFLSLAHNQWLKDERIQMFASVCPNLETLDVSYCRGVSDGVVEVLRRCCKIRHLSLPWTGAKLFRLDFEVPTLFALNLSGSSIGDETLSAISRSCYRLKLLDLDRCHEITAKGVKQVVENCKQLRTISLKSCERVAADVVAWMVFARPSLRNITAPPRFHLTDGQRELFLRHGCLVCEHEGGFCQPMS